MKLYHGTTEKHLSDILRFGIFPRGERESNYKYLPSDPHCVYLTNTWAVWYAMSAGGDIADSPDVVPHTPLMIEIDTAELDQSLYRPDEDYAKQIEVWCKRANKKLPRGWTTDIHKIPNAWKESMKSLGNMAYAGKVPREAMTRICVLDLRACPNIFSACYAMNIDLATHDKAQHMQRNVLRHFFDGTPIDLELIRQMRRLIVTRNPHAKRNFEQFMAKLAMECSVKVYSVPL